MKSCAFLFLMMSVTVLAAATVGYGQAWGESSNGLRPPEMEGGHTELEFGDRNLDGNLDLLSIGDHGSPYITTVQHGNYQLVISSMHAHLDEINCLEIILMKGKVREMKQLADSLISTKGIKYGKFVSATTGSNL